MDFRTADLSDQNPQGVRVCEVEFRSFGAISRFSGPVATVRVYEDNGLIQEAIEHVAPGSVLVVDGGGSLRCALLGGNLAGAAATRHLAGVIVYGAVRDVLELAHQRIGVFALGSNPKRPSKAGAGALAETVRFGGVTFTPGQFVYADEDGVLVAQQELI